MSAPNTVAVPNDVICRNLIVPTAEKRIREYSTIYQTRIWDHPDYLTINLLDNGMETS